MNVPSVDFCGKRISRLIVGGNPVSGTSHASKEMSSAMEDYFTAENTKKMLRDCVAHGITTMQMRADKHIMRILREFRNEGGEIDWIAQTAPEIGNFTHNVEGTLKYSPIMIYHHGVQTDNMFKEGRHDELIARLKIIRDTGVVTGLCTHMPEVIEFAEEKKLDVDFYMCCLYNISVPERMARARAEKSEDPLYVPGDQKIMLEAIRSTDKPCLAFKFLAATRRCKTQEDVRAAFDETYAGIKPGDAAIVGMYPKEQDQVALNARYAAEAIEKAAK